MPTYVKIEEEIVERVKKKGYNFDSVRARSHSTSEDFHKAMVNYLTNGEENVYVSLLRTLDNGPSRTCKVLAFKVGTDRVVSELMVLDSYGLLELERQSKSSRYSLSKKGKALCKELFDGK